MFLITSASTPTSSSTSAERAGTWTGAGTRTGTWSWVSRTKITPVWRGVSSATTWNGFPLSISFFIEIWDDCDYYSSDYQCWNSSPIKDS